MVSEIVFSRFEAMYMHHQYTEYRIQSTEYRTSNTELGHYVLIIIVDEGKSQAVYYMYISSCHVLIDKALSSDQSNDHWFEADWLHRKCDALSSNRKVDGSRLTGSTQACHS